MSDPQRSLFDTEPEPWEADDQAEQLVAGIVLATGPAQEFDYLVPDALRDQVEPGRRVHGAAGQGQSAGAGLLRAGREPAGRTAAAEAAGRSGRSPQPALAGHAAAHPLDRRLLPLPLGPGAGDGPAGRRPRAGRHADGHALDSRSARGGRDSWPAERACRTSIARSSARWRPPPSRSRRRNWPATARCSPAPIATLAPQGSHPQPDRAGLHAPGRPKRPCRARSI